MREGDIKKSIIYICGIHISSVRRAESKIINAATSRQQQRIVDS